MVNFHSDLAASVSSPVYKPGDPEYAHECQGFNTAILNTPSIVIAATSNADIVETIRFARERCRRQVGGTHISIQATGHGAFSPITSGIMITTGFLDSVNIDPEARIATIGAGTRWNAVVSAAAAHGLTPVAGSSTNVGAIGYLLGGGLGPLARSHGYSSDYVLGFTVVTGTGDLVTVTAPDGEGDSQYDDLFWALRGGKKGLGVVTQLRVRLISMSTLYGGSLIFDDEHVLAALKTWASWTATADPSVTTSVVVASFGQGDDRRRQLILRFAYGGDHPEYGAQLAAPLRSAAPVLSDQLGLMAVSDIDDIHGDPIAPCPSWITSMTLKNVHDDFANKFLNLFSDTNFPVSAIELRHIGSPTTRRDDGSDAVGCRRADYTLGFGSMDTNLFERELPAAVDRIMDDLKLWIDHDTFNVNLMGKPRSANHLSRGWTPEIFERLQRVRAKYDPDHLFAD